ncbi:hypothetical protein L3Q82_004718 [Scortum barcoo]|uniref:Uncharacterized protein n=1 Tax=Scortum barcoo TaxID=214431 RepID=A0ACB8VH72_9TELE|nr:hypothetical protein L3Q82_004718 [Scortum barcoo]
MRRLPAWFGGVPEGQAGLLLNSLSSFDDLVKLTTRIDQGAFRLTVKRDVRLKDTSPPLASTMPALSHGGSSLQQPHTREPEPMQRLVAPDSAQRSALHAVARVTSAFTVNQTSRPLRLPMPNKRTDSTVEGEVFVSCPCHLSASALDGHLLGMVTLQTESIHMLLSGNHHETIQFHILHSPRLPLILGYPWLRRHNPHVDWLTGAILGWGSSCHQVCLLQAVVPQSSRCSSTPPDLTGVPTEYLDFSHHHQRGPGYPLWKREIRIFDPA